ncbi:MAG: hypothetical protein NWF11_00120 [Candidatus Bathyarchaeota archaeon]|nr:hypothetical protein [Candidatus Bathyarchaeota archaeon]
MTADYHGNKHAVHKTIKKAEASSADSIIVVGDITHSGSIKDAKSLLSVFWKQPCQFYLFQGVILEAWQMRKRKTYDPFMRNAIRLRAFASWVLEAHHLAHLRTI